MSIWVYIGILMFAVGLYVWLFGRSRLQNMQNSFVPVPASRIRKFQIVSVLGLILFVGGFIVSLIAFF